MALECLCFVVVDKTPHCWLAVIAGLLVKCERFPDNDLNTLCLSMFGLQSHDVDSVDNIQLFIIHLHLFIRYGFFFIYVLCLTARNVDFFFFFFVTSSEALIFQQADGETRA